MDPTMPTKPKHWRRYKGASVAMLASSAGMSEGSDDPNG